MDVSAVWSVTFLSGDERSLRTATGFHAAWRMSGLSSAALSLVRLSRRHLLRVFPYKPDVWRWVLENRFHGFIWGKWLQVVKLWKCICVWPTSGVLTCSPCPSTVTELARCIFPRPDWLDRESFLRVDCRSWSQRSKGQRIREAFNAPAASLMCFSHRSGSVWPSALLL